MIPLNASSVGAKRAREIVFRGGADRESNDCIEDFDAGVGRFGGDGRVGGHLLADAAASAFGGCGRANHDMRAMLGAATGVSRAANRVPLDFEVPLSPLAERGELDLSKEEIEFVKWVRVVAAVFPIVTCFSSSLLFV